MKDHIILVGLGHVGFRVLLELEKFGQNMLVVERDEHSEFVSEAAGRKIPVLFEDARNNETLRRAGIEHARAVIACTDNDLVNIEVGLDSREMNPSIRVVLRLFDQRLAEKVAKGFDIHVALSSSALAAPAFAAAAVDGTVKSSFYVKDRLHAHCEFRVPATSGLVGKQFSRLGEEYGVHTLAVSNPGDSLRWTPEGRETIPADSTIHVVGPFDQLRKLREDGDFAVS